MEFSVGGERKSNSQSRKFHSNGSEKDRGKWESSKGKGISSLRHAASGPAGVGAGIPHLNGHQEIISLNVGGTLFMTTRSTLLSQKSSEGKSTYFHALLDGPMPCLRDKNGAYFLDRSPQYFSHILDFLRTGKYPCDLDRDMQKRLYEEAAFYQIPAPPPNSLTDLGVEVPTDEHLRNIKASLKGRRTEENYLRHKRAWSRVLKIISNVYSSKVLKNQKVATQYFIPSTFLTSLKELKAEYELNFQDSPGLSLSLSKLEEKITIDDEIFSACQDDESLQSFLVHAVSEHRFRLSLSIEPIFRNWWGSSQLQDLLLGLVVVTRPSLGIERDPRESENQMIVF